MEDNKIQVHEEEHLLAGHPPAMKVGGMRVPQPRIHHPESASPPSEEKETQQPNKVSPNAVITMVSGAPVKLKEAFPPEAVRVAHDAKIPKHSKVSTGHPLEAGPRECTRLIQPMTHQMTHKNVIKQSQKAPRSNN